MTVSKALSDAPDISAETKARLQKLAAQMGYVPDAVARSLRIRSSRLLGLVIPATTHPAYARVALALEQRAFEEGYELIVAHHLGSAEREEAVIRRLVARRVDGLFVAPVYRLSPTAAIYAELVRGGTPTVILGQRAPFCGVFANVETDEQKAGYEMTRHLLQLGHRAIALLAGPSVSPINHERLEGYRRALREADLESDDRLIFEAGVTLEDGAKAAGQLIQEAPQATAILAHNDLVAIGAAEIFLGQGRRIPQDISIAGAGNFMVAEHFKVPLTTTHQPKHRAGLAAFECMKALLAGQPPESRRLPAEPIIRQSTAAPPK